VDLSEQLVTVPEDAQFGRPGEPGNVLALALGLSARPIEISEVVPLNQISFVETNGTSEESPDWLEIRNYSRTPVPLSGLALTKQFGDNSVFFFPTGRVLQPGEHFLVLCDGNSSEGALHAPFTLKSSGDQVLLLDFSTNGAAILADSTSFGPMPTDLAWARLGAQGPWQNATPTPLSENLTSPFWDAISINETARVFRLGFPTVAGKSYIVEETASLATPLWNTVINFAGDGIERLLTWPLEGQRFFRVRSSSP
jgi:hypothetical protein